MPSRLSALIAAAGATRPLLIALAGSNGAGKSTFYTEALSGTGYPLVNADEIARVLSNRFARPIDELAYEAMDRADKLRNDLVAQRVSFITETVLSDPKGAKLDFFSRAQAAGYFVLLILITLEDVEASIARVAQRVLNGGHDVPDEKLLARFNRTRANAAKALVMADLALVFDNSSPQSPFRWVETWEGGRCVSRA
jgi:predicted ABC-type ATPase